MIEELLSHPIKLVLASGAAQTGLLLATHPTEGEVSGWVQAVRELGSFGIIAALVIGSGWFLKTIIPQIIEQQEKRYSSFLAALESLRLSNESALSAERQLREHSIDAFREMLQSHKTDMSAGLSSIDSNIVEGNKISAALVEELHKRPCQIKH